LEACRAYPGVGSRFIFFTATTDPRLVRFLSENGGQGEIPSKAFFNAGHTGHGGGCPQQTRIARNREWRLAFERSEKKHRKEGSYLD